MPVKNLHDKPFDEDTITKLSIFEKYAKTWIPTFVMTPYYNEIWIIDFFAGPGYDKSGVEGSPIRILKQIRIQLSNIFQTSTKIHICFNEFEKEKFDSLVNSCNEYINSDEMLKRANEKHFLNINYENKDVKDIFPVYVNKIKGKPALIYLDQNGVKFLADNYFQELVKLQHVDFLYYISSSYYVRFGNTPAFKTILNIDKSILTEKGYYHCHQQLVEYLESKITPESNFYLFPFSIKKGTNIYGIAFGTSHPLGIEKFLKITWKENPINGLANFDIDQDELKSYEEDLFGNKYYTKLELFELSLKKNLLSGKLRNNEDVYLFTLMSGHIPSQAADIIKKLKKENKIFYAEKSPLVSYEQIYKNNRIINYQILGEKNEFN